MYLEFRILDVSAAIVTICVEYLVNLTAMISAFLPYYGLVSLARPFT